MDEITNTLKTKERPYFPSDKGEDNEMILSDDFVYNGPDSWYRKVTFLKHMTQRTTWICVEHESSTTRYEYTTVSIKMEDMRTISKLYK